MSITRNLDGTMNVRIAIVIDSNGEYNVAGFHYNSWDGEDRTDDNGDNPWTDAELTAKAFEGIDTKGARERKLVFATITVPGFEKEEIDAREMTTEEPNPEDKEVEEVVKNAPEAPSASMTKAALIEWAEGIFDGSPKGTKKDLVAMISAKQSGDYSELTGKQARASLKATEQNFSDDEIEAMDRDAAINALVDVISDQNDAEIAEEEAQNPLI